MTQPQVALSAILAAVLVLLAWGRWRHDLVAVTALVAASAAGLVPPDGVLDGFANPAVGTFVALLILAAGVRNAGVLLAPVRLLRPWLGQAAVQAPVLGAIAAAAAAALGSQGAAAAFAPVPGQVLRRSGRWPSQAAHAVSLAFILGGLLTLIGSLPNLLVSGQRRQVAGTGYGMFDFAPVGLPAAAAGLLLLALAWRLLPRPPVTTAPAPANAAPANATPAAAGIERYTSEAVVPPDSPAVGRDIAGLEARGDGPLQVLAVIREGFRRLAPRPGLQVAAGDILVLACNLDTLQRFTGRLRLQITPGGEVADPERIGVIEAVVSPGSRLSGQSCAEAGLAARATLLGIGRAGPALMRLHRIKLQAGDVLVLQGERAAMPAVLAEFGCLLLAERRLRLGRRQQALAPGLLLAAALGLAATGVLPLVVALLGAAALLVLLRVLSLNEAYASVDWSVVVLAGALLPLASALDRTGLAALAADGLAGLLGGRAPTMVALVLAASLAAASAFGGVPAALLLGPVAAALAARLGAALDPFLMAVALGASCPMRPSALPLPAAQGWDGGAGRWRIALPLAVLVFMAGLPLILLAWPPQPGAAPGTGP